MAQGDRFRAALGAARSSPWWLAACVLLLPLVNWVLTSAAVWVLTARYGPVRWPEMLALVGSAWLLNHLPMRVGMVGRIAYHRRFHGIRVRDCLKALVLNVAATGAALLLLLSVVLAAGRQNYQVGGLLILLPPVLLAVALALLRRRALTTTWLRWPAIADFAGREFWRLPAVLLLRYLDILIWALRYWLVFSMLGDEVGWLATAAVTAAGQAAMFTPIQFGLREWVVGAVVALLPLLGVQAGAAPQAEGLLARTAPGLMADVVMRASELAVVLPVGLASTWWVWRNAARIRAPHANQADSGAL